MMSKNLKKMLAMASNPISGGAVCEGDLNIPISNQSLYELIGILEKKNGFWAFEQALRVFPLRSDGDKIGMVEWNNQACWIKDYQGLADGLFFFAEDAFGNQFCIRDNVIGFFDAETAEVEEIADSLEGWCQVLLSDYNYWTGYSLLKEWQLANGKLDKCCRLMPKIPFVCGGEYTVENLVSINAVSGMRSRGNLAHQIVELADGSQIEFRIIE